jgi:hypothetical protein
LSRSSALAFCPVAARSRRLCALHPPHCPLGHRSPIWTAKTARRCIPSRRARSVLGLHHRWTASTARIWRGCSISHCRVSRRTRQRIVTFDRLARTAPLDSVFALVGFLIRKAAYGFAAFSSAAAHAFHVIAQRLSVSGLPPAQYAGSNGGPKIWSVVFPTKGMSFLESSSNSICRRL